MRRGWYFLLVLSLGLNAGLLVSLLGSRAADPGDRPVPLPEVLPPCLGEPHLAAGLYGLVDTLSHHRVRALGRFLQLDDSQREQMTRVREALIPSIIAEREEVRGLRRAVHQALEQAEMNPDSIAQLAGEFSRTQARLDSLVLQAMLQEAGLLSPEQRRRYFGAMQWGAPPLHPRVPPGRGRRGAHEAARHR